MYSSYIPSLFYYTFIVDTILRTASGYIEGKSLGFFCSLFVVAAYDDYVCDIKFALKTLEMGLEITLKTLKMGS